MENEKSHQPSVPSYAANISFAPGVNGPAVVRVGR